MREIWSGETAGWWWRVTRRTHGVQLGISVHWPSPTWHQWQVGFLVVDVKWGRRHAETG